MMEKKSKPCKGSTLETKGFGCGKPSVNRTYGLCPSCKYDWSKNTESGAKWFSKMSLSLKKTKAKEEKAEFTKLKKEFNAPNAMKLADTYFSRFVRLFYSFDGLCTCYTCGALKPIKETDNGHYQKREHKATRYHIDNCRPQCKTCNGDTKHNGKQDIFRANLSYELGEEYVCQIEKLAKTAVKADTAFYSEIAEKYRIKVNELQVKMKVKIW